MTHTSFDHLFMCRQLSYIYTTLVLLLTKIFPDLQYMCSCLNNESSTSHIKKTEKCIHNKSNSHFSMFPLISHHIFPNIKFPLYFNDLKVNLIFPYFPCAVVTSYIITLTLKHPNTYKTTLYLHKCTKLEINTN